SKAKTGDSHDHEYRGSCRRPVNLSDRFSLARGQINGAAARTAVFMIVRITGLRLAGIIMGILLFRFQWWAPIAIVVSISGLKVWLLRDIRTYELGLQSEVSNLRRAH